MRRLVRGLIDALMVLSLLLAVGVAALWVRSYRVVDAFTRAKGFQFSCVLSERGNVSVSRSVCLPEFTFTWPWRYGRANAKPYVPDRNDPGVRWDFQVFGFRSRLTRGGRGAVTVSGTSSSWTTYSAGWSFGVPHALLVLLLAAPAAIRLRAYRRRRFAPGLCPDCGYDLRATPDRCPECGAVPGTPTA